MLAKTKACFVTLQHQTRVVVAAVDVVAHLARKNWVKKVADMNSKYTPSDCLTDVAVGVNEQLHISSQTMIWHYRSSSEWLAQAIQVRVTLLSPLGLLLWLLLKLTEYTCCSQPDVQTKDSGGNRPGSVRAETNEVDDHIRKGEHLS